jgi:hypothetical protein
MSVSANDGGASGVRDPAREQRLSESTDASGCFDCAVAMRAPTLLGAALRATRGLKRTLLGDVPVGDRPSVRQLGLLAE